MASSCSYKEVFQVQEGKDFQDEEGEEFQVKEGMRHVFLIFEGLLIIFGHKLEGSRTFLCLGCKFHLFSMGLGFLEALSYPPLKPAALSLLDALNPCLARLSRSLICPSLLPHLLSLFLGDFGF